MTGLEAARSVEDARRGACRVGPPRLQRSQPIPERRRTCPRRRPIAAPTWPRACPATRSAYVEFRDAGADIKFLVTQLMTCLDEANYQDPSAWRLRVRPSASCERLLGVAPEDYFDFVQDAGVGITADRWQVRRRASSPRSTTRTSPGLASSDILSALARLAGGLGDDSGITVDRGAARRRHHHDDHDPGDPRRCSASRPVRADAPGVAVANGRLYLGLDDFVAKALDQSAADSLASSRDAEVGPARKPAPKTRASPTSTSRLCADSRRRRCRPSDQGDYDAEVQAIPRAARHACVREQKRQWDQRRPRISLRRVTCRPRPAQNSAGRQPRPRRRFSPRGTHSSDARRRDQAANISLRRVGQPQRP